MCSFNFAFQGKEKTMPMPPNAAVIMIDVTRDFMPGGALPIVDGDQVVEPCCELLEFVLPQDRFVCLDQHLEGDSTFACSYRKTEKFDPVPFDTVLTYDDVELWDGSELASHANFTLLELQRYLFRSAYHHRLFSKHGVPGTADAKLHADVAALCKARNPFFKGDGVAESFSGWMNALNQETEVARKLRRAHEQGQYKTLFIGGLAGDVCVMHFAIDAAAEAGYDVAIVDEAVRNLDQTPKGIAQWRRRLKALGVRTVSIKDLR